MTISKEKIEELRKMAEQYHAITRPGTGIIGFGYYYVYNTKIRKFYKIKDLCLFEIHLEYQTFCKATKNKKIYVDDDDFVYFYDENKNVLFFAIKD